ncbi:hypothetical protein IWX90DRAFT_516698 [Phyllosticta citrichinensis]|uniref:BTB domain-containing protein n=1 Tax=Phyllosticta citrichinensis TaxID=1130410 RepID=A0ABR1XHY1_9PEZI
MAPLFNTADLEPSLDELIANAYRQDLQVFNNSVKGLTLPHEWPGPFPPFRDHESARCFMENVTFVRCGKDYFKGIRRAVAVKHSKRFAELLAQPGANGPDMKIWPGLHVQGLEAEDISPVVAFWETGQLLQACPMPEDTTDVLELYARLYFASNAVKSPRLSELLGAILWDLIERDPPLDVDDILFLFAHLSSEGDSRSMTPKFIQSLIRRYPVAAPHDALLEAASESHDFAVELLESIFLKRRNISDGSTVVRRFIQTECQSCNYVMAHNCGKMAPENDLTRLWTNPEVEVRLRDRTFKANRGVLFNTSSLFRRIINKNLSIDKINLKLDDAAIFPDTEIFEVFLQAIISNDFNPERSYSYIGNITFTLRAYKSGQKSGTPQLTAAAASNFQTLLNLSLPKDLRGDSFQKLVEMVYNKSSSRIACIHPDRDEHELRKFFMGRFSLCMSTYLTRSQMDRLLRSIPDFAADYVFSFQSESWKNPLGSESAPVHASVFLRPFRQPSPELPTIKNGQGSDESGDESEDSEGSEESGDGGEDT